MANTATPHLELMTILVEVVFVAALTLIAGKSPMAETMVTTLFVGLWLAFLVKSGPLLVSKLKPRS